MKNVFRYCSLAALCAGTTHPASAADPLEMVVRARGDAGSFVEMDADGAFSAANGVTITFGNTILTAEKAVGNEKTGDVEAQGSVILKYENPKGGDQLWTGDRLHYNFNSHLVDTGRFRTGHDPIFISGETLRSTGNQTNLVYHGTNAIITSDDYDHPAQKIRARKIAFVPGEYINAESATIYLEGVPVFYVPYYHRSLKPHPNNFAFLPGYRSLYGPYLFSTYNWYWDERFSGALHADYYANRGLGLGGDLKLNFGAFGQGLLKYYHINDQNPGLDPDGNAIPKDRQRFAFSYEIVPRTNLTVKVEANYQSDAEFIRDFFISEYRKNSQPNSFLEVNQAWSNWSVNMLAQPRINTVFETIERLPDVQINGLRQQIGQTPFYYESSSDGAYLDRKFVDPKGDFSAARFDTFHQILMPETFFGFLNVTPRAGERLTYYSEAQGPDVTTTEQTRSVFNTGVEVSVKASRLWENVQSRFWEVNGLRHIFQPSVNYVFVPAPNVLPSQLPQFDYEIPSLRPLPVDFPDYNAIDSIDSQNVIRFSVDNRLQTKRGNKIDNLVDWDLSLDWRLRPNQSQSTFGFLYSDLALKPRSWFTFRSVVRYDLNQNQWTESDSRAVFQPVNDWSFSLGHRYLSAEPALGPIYGVGNNTIYASIYHKFNENWGMRMSQHYEAAQGIWQEQAYTVYRDLRSWTIALTLRYVENVGSPNDLTVAVAFSLKATPRFSVGQDSDRPETLFGR